MCRVTYLATCALNIFTNLGHAFCFSVISHSDQHSSHYLQLGKSSVPYIVPVDDYKITIKFRDGIAVHSSVMVHFMLYET